MAEIKLQEQIIESTLDNGTKKVFDNPNLAFAYIDAYNWTFGELLKNWDGKNLEMVVINDNIPKYVEQSDKYDWFDSNGKCFIVLKNKNLKETLKMKEQDNGRE